MGARCSHVAHSQIPLENISITNETLKAIGIEEIPMIYAYNKIDLKDGEIPESQDNSLYISPRASRGWMSWSRRFAARCSEIT
ncbi:hypothetical protein [Paenibacillus sp. NAIST15-1]|uniref:hypothetical protein n=1 Tax=Paenibacillus sp. NAIST15-1 TaxID=1605994 RepID=UPI000933FF80|nr:hypothetical protein [Paenibacillus sp. NAIST15-1]